MTMECCYKQSLFNETTHSKTKIKNFTVHVDPPGQTWYIMPEEQCIHENILKEFLCKGN